MEVEQTQEQNEHTYPEGDRSQDNFGFVPLEEAVPVDKPSKITDSPACLVLREQINTMLTDFPELQLRTSVHTMRMLEQYDEGELANILKNCHSDLRLIRGMPGAEFLLYLTCSLVERYIPGYLERCQADTDLKRDVESEMTLLFGGASRRMNILYRLVNNAYQEIFYPENEYNDWAGREAPEPQDYVRTIPPDGERDQNERPHKRTRTSGPENHASH